MEIRKNCKICGSQNPKGFRIYCSTKCRNKHNNRKNRINQLEYQRRKQDEKNSIPSKEKVRCKICGRYYIQIGTHVVQRHNMTAREYREEHNLPLKRGTVPRWYRKKKAEIALENKTYKNLKKGEKFRYKKGDPRAKINTGWKGKLGNGKQHLYEELFN